MSTISIENAVITVTKDGVVYTHDFVTNITIEDPRENSLSISPQNIGDGISYKTNITEPIKLELVVRNLSIPLIIMYKDAFKHAERLDFMVFDSATHERYDIGRAVLKNNPMNTTISEGEESLDVKLIATAPPTRSDHKESDL